MNTVSLTFTGRSAMKLSSTLYIGPDVHKESIAVDRGGSRWRMPRRSGMLKRSRWAPSGLVNATSTSSSASSNPRAMPWSSSMRPALVATGLSLPHPEGTPLLGGRPFVHPQEGRDRVNPVLSAVEGTDRRDAAQLARLRRSGTSRRSSCNLRVRSCYMHSSAVAYTHGQTPSHRVYRCAVSPHGSG